MEVNLCTDVSIRMIANAVVVAPADEILARRPGHGIGIGRMSHSQRRKNARLGWRQSKPAWKLTWMKSMLKSRKWLPNKSNSLPSNQPAFIGGLIPSFNDEIKTQKKR